MTADLEKAYRYCESVTRLHARSFYFAAKFLPRHKQRAVFPIYAFCRHVDDEIDERGERDERDAISAVERWKAELEAVFEDKGQKVKGGKEDEHQRLVFLAWNDLLKTYRIPPKLPLELIEGVLMDTRVKRYETFEDLYLYCYRVASTVGLMSSEILGYADPVALGYAEKMGVGMQLTNILRDVREDAGRGRIYLPQADLQKFNVGEAQILSGQFDRNFAALMKFQVARAREFYREGEKGIAFLEKDSRFTVLLASQIYAKILDEIERQNYDVFARRAQTSKSQKLLAIPKIWLRSKRL